uniref:Uncharacterized protein n=1 Tax=Kalanchoe fedtschenkoi TaxID=63787 RepID=A0A7N0VDN9_KALFE
MPILFLPHEVRIPSDSITMPDKSYSSWLNGMRSEGNPLFFTNLLPIRKEFNTAMHLCLCYKASIGAIAKGTCIPIFFKALRIPNFEPS